MLDEPLPPSAELRAALREAHAELAKLRDLRKRLEAALKETGDRIRVLAGAEGFSHGPKGTIADLEKKAAIAKRVEDDLLLPRVSLVNRFGGTPVEHVVVKVTPKRIFLRTPDPERL